MCPAKPSRRNPKPVKANHAMGTAPTNVSSDVDSSCCAGNASFPAMHGIATAVEHSAHDVPQDPAVTALKRNLQLDVNWRSHCTEPLTTQAPLASPEPLSETSSLASYGSDSFRRQLSGDRRLYSRPAMRMDPIRQSPLCQSSPPTRRLIVNSAQSGPVTGLCFPVDEIHNSSNPESEQESTVCSVVHTVSATTVPSSMCQTVVEVHHHQDSPTQNEASKSISDFVSEQTDDSVSEALLSVDVRAVSLAASADGHEVLHDAVSVADNHCSHAVAGSSSKCQCNRATDVSELEPLDADGTDVTSVAECRSRDDTCDDVCLVGTEVNLVMAGRL